jgi:hypothetical protein
MVQDPGPAFTNHFSSKLVNVPNNQMCLFLANLPAVYVRFASKAEAYLRGKQTLHQPGKVWRDKHTSLFGLFVSYKKNVL